MELLKTSYSGGFVTITDEFTGQLEGVAANIIDRATGNTVARKIIDSGTAVMFLNELKEVPPEKEVELRISPCGCHMFWQPQEKKYPRLVGIEEITPQEYDCCDGPLIVAIERSSSLLEDLENAVVSSWGSI